MHKKSSQAFSLVAVLLMVFLTACSSNSENIQLAQEACASISATYQKDNPGDDYSDPKLKGEYLKSQQLFSDLAKSEASSDKSWSRIFELYASNIERWATGVSYASAGFQEVSFFCGSEYGFTTRSYPSIVANKKYLEDFIGIEIAAIDSSDNDNSYEEMFDWTPIIFLGIFSIYMFAAYWIARTAKRAGRSFAGWFLLGIVIPPLAGIIVLTFKPEKENSNSRKSCPYCAELIQPEAKFCRFCSKEIV